MGQDSKIAWTDHTQNFWIGCEKVSPACRSCYAEVSTAARVSKSRGLPLWGPGSHRHLTAPDNWRNPLKWWRAARDANERHRVFCSSLSDIAEDRRDLDEPRAWMCEAIRRTSCRANWDAGLLWLLLTKRPENLTRLFPRDVLEMCWVGTTAEDQQRADERIPHLLATPAAVRFVSVEPMLGPVDLFRYLEPFQDYDPALRPTPRLSWCIVGSESGPRARPFQWSWAESLRSQCAAAGAAFFMKQGPDLRRGKTSTEPNDWPSASWPREWPQ